ncbi:hypothetical protein [Thioalkalivibrio sp. ALMg11]|uniref:hypothetical protein n=1 Tax=Thioalkalivibrio sp. ALMg11 TaxID=1158165 RepID=UPI0012DD4111|nr:hypothetical protein [Thioalkalivibrio sp. ALMg11]
MNSHHDPGFYGGNACPGHPFIGNHEAHEDAKQVKGDHRKAGKPEGFWNEDE